MRVIDVDCGIFLFFEQSIRGHGSSSVKSPHDCVLPLLFSTVCIGCSCDDTSLGKCLYSLKRVHKQSEDAEGIGTILEGSQARSSLLFRVHDDRRPALFLVKLTEIFQASTSASFSRCSANSAQSASFGGR